MFYREGLLATPPNPKLEDNLLSVSTTAYSIYSQLPSITEAVPLTATWGRAMPWWQVPTTNGFTLRLMYINLADLFLGRDLFQIKSCRENQTHNLCSRYIFCRKS